MRASPTVGPADPVRGRRLSRRAGVGADLRAAIRRPPVNPPRSAARTRCGSRRAWRSASRSGSRSRCSTGSDQPLTHDEREYLALARSVARGEGFQLSGRRAGARDRPAVRPRARLPALPRGARHPARRQSGAAPHPDRAGVRRRARHLADRGHRRPRRRPARRRDRRRASRPSIRRSSGCRRTCSAKRCFRPSP